MVAAWRLTTAHLNESFRRSPIPPLQTPLQLDPLGIMGRNSDGLMSAGVFLSSLARAVRFCRDITGWLAHMVA